MKDLHISLVAEKIFGSGIFTVTNTMFTSWIVTVLVSLVLLSIVATLKKKPGVVQNLYEVIYTFIYQTIEDVTGKDLAHRLFPLFLSIFFFILVGSWFGLLPISGSIGFFEEPELGSIEHGEPIPVPIFRAPTADINTALALSLIAFIVIEYYGFRQHGFAYLKKFFNFHSPVNVFVGLLELLSEFMRIITFSFRLFGNIFAGEVIIAVMLALTGSFFGVAVFPFLAFEVFVGVVQAFVFVMLTAVFISLAVETVEH
jgi:F-type H+-transporting ATPase subunit a